MISSFAFHSMLPIFRCGIVDLLHSFSVVAQLLKTIMFFQYFG